MENERDGKLMSDPIGNKTTTKFYAVGHHNLDIFDLFKDSVHKNQVSAKDLLKN